MILTYFNQNNDAYLYIKMPHIVHKPICVAVGLLFYL